MPFQIKVTPAASLASLRKLVDKLSAGNEPASDEAMARLVASAHTLRHAAHLERVFGAWLPTLPPKERTVVAALLGKLVVESAEVGDGTIDDHGGYRAEVVYRLTGARRIAGIRHYYGYNNDEMSLHTDLALTDEGPPKPTAKAPRPINAVRCSFGPPANLLPAAEKLFSFLGNEESLPRETRVRFLLRLLFPWGRYHRGYEGAHDGFYEDADNLYTLTPARRASALRAREDDGEVIPFFMS